jgi:hypothetical protein
MAKRYGFDETALENLRGIICRCERAGHRSLVGERRW